jgi:hypothetical protein
MEFDLTEPLTLTRVGYTQEAFDRLRASRAIPDWFEFDPTQYSDGDGLLNDFFSEVFSQVVPADRSWEYKLSVAISERMMGMEKPDEPVNGMAYPTVPMFGDADNLVIRESFARAGLRPVRVAYIEVAEPRLPTMRVGFFDESRHIEPDGTIEWLGGPGSFANELGTPGALSARADPIA